MADCIFNGTAKRPPMGLAEVTLTLVDAELAEAARRVLGDSEPVPISAGTRTDETEGLPSVDNAAESAEPGPMEIESGPAGVPDDKASRKRRGMP